MWHKPCRTFHPWCLCIKTRCLSTILLPTKVRLILETLRYVVNAEMGQVVEILPRGRHESHICDTLKCLLVIERCKGGSGNQQQWYRRRSCRIVGYSKRVSINLEATLRWRQNEHDSVSNHQPRDCLFNRLFRRRSKKTSKHRVTGLCVGNSPGPVNSPHKGPVTRKMFPFDDVIMQFFEQK